MSLHLKPSEIFYSQDSINNIFTSGDYKHQLIGETLDDLVNGRISVSSIPDITVTKKPGSNKWYTLDNRRLWVFHHLEGVGKCSFIRVNTKEHKYLSACDRNKFSSANKGCAIVVRRSPGGKWWKKIKPVSPKCDESDLLTEDVNINPIETKENIIEILRKNMINRLQRIQRGERLPIVPFYKWSRESQKRLEDRTAPTIAVRAPLRNVSMNTDALRAAHLESITERQKADRQSVVEKHRHGLEELEMCDFLSQAVDEPTHDDSGLHSEANDLTMTNCSSANMVMLERQLKDRETIVENYKHGSEETNENDYQAVNMEISIINDDQQNVMNDIESVCNHATKVVGVIDTKDNVHIPVA